MSIHQPRNKGFSIVVPQIIDLVSIQGGGVPCHTAALRRRPVWFYARWDTKTEECWLGGAEGVQLYWEG